MSQIASIQFFILNLRNEVNSVAVRVALASFLYCKKERKETNTIEHDPNSYMFKYVYMSQEVKMKKRKPVHN